MRYGVGFAAFKFACAFLAIGVAGGLIWRAVMALHATGAATNVMAACIAYTVLVMPVRMIVRATRKRGAGK